MSALVIETPPAVEPVSLAEAKLYLRLEDDFTNDDDLVSSLITAGREAVEAFTARSLIVKGYRQSLDSFPYYTDTANSQLAFPPSYYSLPRYSTSMWNYSQMVKLYAPPLVSVDRITYLSSNDEQWHDMIQAPPLWYPGTTYSATPASSVTDGNGNIQVCISPGTAGHLPPTWSITVGNTTTEGGGGPVWINTGKVTALEGLNEFGSYIVDTDSEPGRMFPGPPGGMWPSVMYVPNAVQFHFTAGYPDPAHVPSVCKTAIKLLVGQWYENREAAMSGSSTELTSGIQRLLWTKRVMDFHPTRG